MSTERVFGGKQERLRHVQKKTWIGSDFKQSGGARTDGYQTDGASGQVFKVSNDELVYLSKKHLCFLFLKEHFDIPVLKTSLHMMFFIW